MDSWYTKAIKNIFQRYGEREWQLAYIKSFLEIFYKKDLALLFNQFNNEQVDLVLPLLAFRGQEDNMWWVLPNSTFLRSLPRIYGFLNLDHLNFPVIFKQVRIKFHSEKSQQKKRTRGVGLNFCQPHLKYVNKNPTPRRTFVVSPCSKQASHTYGGL